MPREIPQGKKMPSVTMIDVKAPTGNKGGAPDAGADPDDSSQEATFSCPECGAKLSVESKSEDAAEAGAGGIGADTLAG